MHIMHYIVFIAIQRDGIMNHLRRMCQDSSVGSARFPLTPLFEELWLQVGWLRAFYWWSVPRHLVLLPLQMQLVITN